MPQFDVTIAGELNLDLVLHGVPEEIPRERELLVSDCHLTLGSSSAILAHNLASFGTKVGFASCVGDDQFGDMARARLRDANVDVSKVAVLPGRKTALTVIMQRESWRNMLSYPGTIFDLSFQHLDLEYLSSAKHFHFSSYYLQRGLRHELPKLFQSLKAAGLSTSLDCNDDPEDRWGDDIFEALRYTDIFLPNAREAMLLTGTGDVQSAIEKLAQQVELVIVKMGASGAIARRGGQQWSSRALNIALIDPVGAGDSFDAGFLHEYLRGSEIETCLAAGNRAGALSVTRAGGTEAFRDAAYRERFLREHPL